MLEMAINNVEMGSELDRVHILTCCACGGQMSQPKFLVPAGGGCHNPSP